MRKFAPTIAVVLLCAGLFCFGGIDLACFKSAHAQVPTTGAGLGTPSSGGGSYTGPGNLGLSASIYAFVGFRAYNASYAAGGSGHAMDVCDTATGLICTTVNYLSSGLFDKTTASGLSQCASSCSVKQMYDSSGANNCNSGPCNFSNNIGNLTNWPVLQFNANGSLPALKCASANSSVLIMNNPNGALSQPFTLSSVAERTTPPSAAFSDILTDGNIDGGFNSTTSQLQMFANSVVTASATDNVLHAIQYAFNSSSSTIYVDGTNTGVNPGTAGHPSNADVRICGSSSSQFLDGYVMEVSLWSGAFSGSDNSAMNSNQHSATNGYNF
jgi:hypothetical protein